MKIAFVFIIIIALSGVLLVTKANAQAALILPSLQYDAAVSAYRLEVFIASPETVDLVQITLWDSTGIEIGPPILLQPGTSQSVDLNASDLIAGESYRIEAIAFAQNGSPLVTEQDRVVSAEREFIHAPSRTSVRIGNPLLLLDIEAQELSVELATVSSERIANYRVILKDADTNLVKVDESVSVHDARPISLSLAGVPDGEYALTVQALGMDDKALAVAGDVFTYRRPVPTLDQPYFEFDYANGELHVHVRVQDADRVHEYQVRLIMPQDSQIVYRDTVSVQEASPIKVRLGALPGGECLVLVDVVDAAGQLLASTSGQTIYLPPEPPGFFQTAVDGLRANPWIALTIGFVIVAIVGWLVFRSLWERYVSGTPVLQREGIRTSRKPDLPVIQKPARRKVRSESSVGGRHRRGAKPPRLVVTVEVSPDEEQVGHRMPVTHFPFVIGRGAGDLNFVTDEDVSRHHAEIRFSQRGLYVMDMLSSHGTYINGKRIAAETPVLIDPDKRTRIRLGKQTQIILEPYR